MRAEKGNVVSLRNVPKGLRHSGLERRPCVYKYSEPNPSLHMTFPYSKKQADADNPVTEHGHHWPLRLTDQD